MKSSSTWREGGSGETEQYDQSAARLETAVALHVYDFLPPSLEVKLSLNVNSSFRALDLVVTGAKESDLCAAIDVWPGSLGIGVLLTSASCVSVVGENTEKRKEGSNRCSTCRKRVGLTTFNYRCGNMFCSVHRYSGKHGCTFDCRATPRDAIVGAKLVVKAQKSTKSRVVLD
ncbi:hypothetical protein RJ640_008571 [Escallonia rubra]|uniref:AN1-type domain-containing protein n=1 Tax=Escallonia rubra TaxID=112253 RepID=A0AA88UDE6_9ASTE|nr:hypothetical protein RJ640_008571 [Escallonia rubra]